MISCALFISSGSIEGKEEVAGNCKEDEFIVEVEELLDDDEDDDEDDDDEDDDAFFWLLFFFFFKASVSMSGLFCAFSLSLLEILSISNLAMSCGNGSSLDPSKTLILKLGPDVVGSCVRSVSAWMIFPNFSNCVILIKKRSVNSVKIISVSWSTIFTRKAVCRLLVAVLKGWDGWALDKLLLLHGEEVLLDEVNVEDSTEKEDIMMIDNEDEDEDDRKKKYKQNQTTKNK